MKFKEFGNLTLPTIIFLHGGGLSWWSLEKIIAGLQSSYHVVTPIIDGHGEDGATTFISIEDSATKLISYIDENYQGKIFALAGLSIGAQIVTEVLARRTDITQYAIIESVLLYPIKAITALTIPIYKLIYGLIKHRWFAKMQAKSLFVPEAMFQQYFEDSLKISKQSLINLTISNGSYCLKEEIKNTKAKVLIIVGGKELQLMKKSARKLQATIPNSQLYVAEKMGHGEISLVNYPFYLKLLADFLV
ncbi:MAG: alpha/beta hydrolase [Clostridia bacterium]